MRIAAFATRTWWVFAVPAKISRWTRDLANRTTLGTTRRLLTLRAQKITLRKVVAKIRISRLKVRLGRLVLVFKNFSHFVRFLCLLDLLI